MDVRQTFRSADAVKLESGTTVTIFNIRGNHFRLITTINYGLGAVQILMFLTHAEYDKEKWKKVL